MNDKIGLSIDIGGTKIDLALFDQQGHIFFCQRMLIASLDMLDPVQSICHLVHQLIERKSSKPVSVISIAAPGAPQDTGELSPNNPGWSFSHTCEALALSFPEAQLVAINDVKAATYAEYHFGESQADSLVYFNLGTGFAAGAMIDGKLLQGAHQVAMELGYLIPSLELFKQGCKSGMAPLESLISGGGIATQLKVAHKDARPSDIFLATPKDALWPIRQRFLLEFSQVVCNTAITLDPQIMMIGGGLAKGCEVLLPEINAYIDEFVPHPIPLTLSSFPDNGSVLGATAIGLEALGVDIPAVAKVLLEDFEQRFLSNINDESDE